ncbi:DUF3606 domain-containing protein [Mucilaginibacter galii]|uniref:DUF3606 domain-containing protein n=1 Tax=Mucilaginibacter galii TaxID=2005073 RepID=A0A917J644_9SPHI|nr:DUF3606 domain-containing protein [Mucilaginibacter galii]GGI49374.1 DUF3606 domain-containing protein [Mucilaginibacter galii]
MDNKKDIGSPDRDRINVHEEYELQDWATSLGVTKEQIKEAVEAVGTSAQKVREYLKK